jgi:chemotaxis family two-component system response regulator Rcp1
MEYSYLGMQNTCSEWGITRPLLLSDASHWQDMMIVDFNGRLVIDPRPTIKALQWRECKIFACNSGAEVIMNSEPKEWQSIEILLVEDNPGDVELTREALDNAKVANRLHVVRDGADAVDFLFRKGKFADAPRPDIILLDLNLPKKDGRQVLSEIKADAGLAQIPVVVLTTSKAEEDILQAYRLHANCYITKPVDFSQFLRVVATIEDFWLNVVRLPKREH